ncbi:Mth938-like domain-containing protein [Accumulibacter sp.]|uniref:Mth938-like domain-containing protein n=1 Tax=Accumulibacter sp. TaxID=2053492 RepID=UPI0025E85B98|nr:MTH938/NDUFAF3 family protein [Accumulibacter sp.]MCM8594852.1 MTH938/NDUFAF3 family protein [Accumulibacter sp.]MCM8626018.1 MTH938/NDUFAF3 family protein [Accumulibacter sp.]MDS4048998.1 MTH938/NDUFAF3 family protein [Accumulibacter sp.]
MKIDATEFGSITVDGRGHPYDILIRLSGEIVKRRKKLSKRIYGTSHTISRDEAEFVYEKGCETLVIGSGQYDNVRLSAEAADFFAAHHCRVVLQPTPEAIRVYNHAHGRTVGLFHVTC